jgi:large conductance mechanosensitive channel
MHALWEDFKKFVMQGDLVAIAVAFILGLAFKDVIDSVVNDLINPVIGAVVGKPTFDDLTFDIGDGVVRIGSFISVLINFLIVAVVLFVVVKAYEKLKSLRSPAEKAADPTELEVLQDIRELLRNQQRPAG